MKVEATFLVPTVEDDTKRKHTYTRIEDLEKYLVEKYEGFQGPMLTPGSYKGQSEESWKYKVAMSENQVEEFKEFLRKYVRIIFHQKVIYCEIKGEVEFLE